MNCRYSPPPKVDYTSDAQNILKRNIFTKQANMMSPRTKSILALSGTLLLGMVLGGLLTGAVIKKRTQAFALQMMNEDRFVHRLTQLLEPTPQQSDTVSSILHSHGQRITTRSRQFRAAQWRTLDSLKSALHPVLTPEQNERFLRALERMDKRKER